MSQFWIRPDSAGPTPLPFFTPAELDDVRTFYAGAPRTPLHRLSHLAESLGIGDVLVKDETSRFELPAFKVLGAQYAVAQLLARGASAVKGLACATAGNHGRAVARVAYERALDAHVYVPIGTAPATIDALRDEAAHVVVTSVDYDETVRLMAEDAAEEGWTIVSDTAWDDYEQIPRWIMVGYTQLMNEAADAWGDPPDIVVVQAGVGSLAGAVAGWLQAMFDGDGPTLIIVEPDGSACVQASLAAGTPQRLISCAPTAMAGLRCGVVSPVAWPILRTRTDAAMSISDEICTQAQRRLAAPEGGDPAMTAGPSGAAGVAALLALAGSRSMKELRRHFDINRNTRVLTIVTEGRGRR